MAIRAKRTGMIILGGGVIKHHICNANLMVSYFICVIKFLSPTINSICERFSVMVLLLRFMSILQWNTMEVTVVLDQKRLFLGGK